ncbi:MAG: DUF2094 domain-containing protein [Planctomycetes bacterium]|nr:DUF2094 domain-containing protein [Planctomycetota bacterium]
MFGFRRRENPTIQLYGKLPLAKDYLRLGFGEGAGLLLREWLDATFSGGAGRDSVAEPAGAFRFVAGDAWDACLQGTLVPSSDAGGLRAFPFMIGVERRRRAVVEDLAQGWVQADGVWQELRRLRESCAMRPDGRSMLASMRGSVLDVAAVTGASGAPIEVESWLQALWPDRGLVGLEADLERLLAAGEEVPWRLPLARGGSYRQQVLAWLVVLGRLGLFESGSCPTLFFPEADTPVYALGEYALEENAPAEAAGATEPTDLSVGEGGPGPFLAVFHSPLRPALGRWLQVPGTEGPLGNGDLVGGRPPGGQLAVAASTGLPPLAASLRSTVATFLSRHGLGRQ